jgi:hypothetical protein
MIAKIGKRQKPTSSPSFWIMKGCLARSQKADPQTSGSCSSARNERYLATKIEKWVRAKTLIIVLLRLMGKKQEVKKPEWALRSWLVRSRRKWVSLCARCQQRIRKYILKLNHFRRLVPFLSPLLSIWSWAICAPSFFHLGAKKSK